MSQFFKHLKKEILQAAEEWVYNHTEFDTSASICLYVLKNVGKLCSKAS